MRVLPVLVALAIIMAGCTGSSDDPEETNTETSTNTDTGTNSTQTNTGTTTNTGTSEPGKGTITPELTTTVSPIYAPGTVTYTLDATWTDKDGNPTDAPAAYNWDVTVAYDGGDASEVGSGFELPATVEIEFAELGDYEITATITGAGFSDGVAIAAVTAEARPAAAPIFTEDFETDLSAWVVTNNNDPLIPDETGARDQWEITDEQAATGTFSAHPGYIDEMESVLTGPVISLANANSARLDFAIMGGAEEVSGDGLQVEVIFDGATDLLEHINTIKGNYTILPALDYAPTDGEFTTVSYDLAEYVGSDIRLQFTWISDLSCSRQTPLPNSGGCGGGNYLAYWIDDIQVWTD